jgi:hypothetical protein
MGLSVGMRVGMGALTRPVQTFLASGTLSRGWAGLGRVTTRIFSVFVVGFFVVDF